MAIEKSLLEIWSKGLPKLPKNNFNRYVSFSGLLLGLLPVVFGQVINFTSIINSLSNVSAQVIGGILGFMIAAFTIFASASNPKYLLEMWRFTPDNSTIPLLKMHMLNFVRCFIYLFLALVYFMVLILLTHFWPTIAKQMTLSSKLVISIQAIVLSLLGFFLITMFVQLKSLIFNLYDLTINHVKFNEADSK